MAILDDKDSLVHEYAAQLLVSLNAQQAIPAIARLFYWYEFDILEVYADVLGAFGPPALDAALSLVTDPLLLHLRKHLGEVRALAMDEATLTQHRHLACPRTASDHTSLALKPT